MTGGLPQPAVNEIPVTQVSVETYELVWKHRRRIAYWSIAPFVLCTLIWFAEDEFTASDLIKGSYVLESANSFGWLVLGTLITVPFQVVVHRLTYPRFDFDLGTYGPPLREVNKYYFIYSFLLFNFAFIVFYNLVYVLNFLENKLLYLIFFFVFCIIYIYISSAFTFIFPATALGVMQSLLEAWWLLRGNLFRLILCIVLTTGPVTLLSLIHHYTFDFSGSSFLYDVIFAAVQSAETLLFLGLWACCASLCYYHVTGRQPLSEMTTTNTENE